MNDELQHLRNLGKTSAQWLHAAGIHSASDLRRLGAVDAYRAVRTRGFRASKVLLYAIEGALMDVHWNDIPAERKEALNRQLDAISRARRIRSTTPPAADKDSGQGPVKTNLDSQMRIVMIITTGREISR